MKLQTVTATIFGALLSLNCASAITIDAFEGAAQVQASTPGVVSNVFSGTQIIGGTRTIAVEKLAGPSSVELEIVAGVLNHSQGAFTTGISTLTWDGDSEPNTIAYNGLGSLDFTRDNGDAMKIDGVYFDYANSQNLILEVKVFDGSDNTGATFATATVTLDHLINNENFSIPFANFIPTGGFSFTRVGAIQLRIPGLTPAFDLSIDSISTNGGCTHAPASGSTIKDDCGVCNGNNESKDECGVCFGNNAAKDNCGVCFGNNVNVDDCGICFGNNTTKDVCGICGGNGTSCLDCAGVPNGVATRDDCGVCAGDGSSCRQCQTQDLTASKISMRADALRQRDEALFFALRIKSVNRQLYRSVVRQINTAYAQVSAAIDALPDTNISCDPSSACITQNANVSSINAILKQIKVVYDRSVRVLTYPITVGDGKCRDSAEKCRARVKARIKEGTTLRTLARKLYRKLKVSVSGLPVSFSVCTPAIAGANNPAEGNQEK